MFCPQCRAEYREGFVKCADCDVPLVDRLPPQRTDRQPGLETDQLVVLRTFPTMVEADLAKSALESVGIDSIVRSENRGGQTASVAFSQGVDLLVRAEDVTAANDMLGIEGLDSSKKR